MRRDTHPTSSTGRRERAAATAAGQQPAHEALDALQQAMDRRDNGGETGH